MLECDHLPCIWQYRDLVEIGNKINCLVAFAYERTYNDGLSNIFVQDVKEQGTGVNFYSLYFVYLLKGSFVAESYWFRGVITSFSNATWNGSLRFSRVHDARNDVRTYRWTMSTSVYVKVAFPAECTLFAIYNHQHSTLQDIDTGRDCIANLVCRVHGTCRNAWMTDFCVHPIHRSVVDQKRVCVSIARECGTITMAEDVLGLILNASDSDLNRLTRDKREQHHGPFQLQTTLLHGWSIDARQKRCYVFHVFKQKDVLRRRKSWKEIL